MGNTFKVSTWDKHTELNKNGEYVSSSYDFTVRYSGESFIKAFYIMCKYKIKKYPYVQFEWR